jgi:regulator of nonsense transcripts 2
MLRSPKSNFAVLRFFGRFIMNISELKKDFSVEISQALIADYNNLSKEDVRNMDDERIKNIRFICEMIKFNAFPMQNIFDILKKLLEDFKGISIDLLCNLMENAGRYLYLNEQSHLKFSNFLENVKQNSQYSKLFIFFFLFFF